MGVINMPTEELWSLMMKKYYAKYGDTSGFNSERDQFFYAVRDDGYEFHQTIYSFFSRIFNEWSFAERGILKLAEGSVLDVGCGSGRHSLWLQTQNKVTKVKAVDLSLDCINIAKSRGVINAEQVDVYTMPVTETFDTILCMGVGGLLTEKSSPKVLLDKALDLLASKGLLLVSSCWWLPGTVHEAYKKTHGIFIRSQLKYSPTPDVTYLGDWETSMQFNRKDLEVFTAKDFKLTDYFEGEYIESFGFVRWSCALRKKK